MVLTAMGKHAYIDRDTFICPIGTLKP
jgi:hypothetical protein